LSKYEQDKDQNDALEIYLTLSGCRQYITKYSNEKDKDPVIANKNIDTLINLAQKF